MSKKKELRGATFARKPAVIATEIAFAMMAAQGAFAQQADQTEEKVERVEVTGSRIPQIGAEAALQGVSPITVIDSEAIKFSGLTKPEDILATLPAVSANQNSTVSNGSNGNATINLRGLGVNRNLVLLNGRRLPPGSPRNLADAYATDLNQIPAPLIERVELLTGGASAVYGSDAISGVVNFIMKDNFEGIQVDFDHNSYYHNQQNPDGVADIIRRRAATNPVQFVVPGDLRGEGPTNNVSLLLGKNFADNKGNATVFFNYKKEDPILQADYDYSACSLGSGASFSCTGSSTSFPGRFTRTDTFVSRTVADAAGNIRPFSSATDQYNFGPLNYFRRPSEQYGFNAFAHLDIHPNIRAYTEFGFHDNHSIEQVAPGGVFFGDQTFTITGANPLLSPAWRTFLGLTLPTDTQDILIGRRNVEGGGRQTDFRYSSYRWVLGAKGDLGGLIGWKDWNYDVFMQTGKVLYSSSDLNFFSKARTSNAIDVIIDPATGQPACRSAVSVANGGTGTDLNCVPYNIWSLGQVRQAALNYLQVPGLQNGYTEQQVQGGTLTADLGSYGLKLPTARHAVSVALGVERRQETLKLSTDNELASFDLSGEGGPNPPQQGRVRVNEWYGEVHVPLIERRPFFYKLSVEGSYRRSDYSTGVKTNTYGVSGKWEPVENYRFRASYNRAIRAANIIELFGPQQNNLVSLQDPCGAAAVAAGTAATLAQCARSGVTAAQYGSIALDSPAGQYNVLNGGNPALTPETANTYTAGLVLTPTRNLTATIDWWSIKIADAVGTAPAQTALNLCVFNNQFCNLIQRDQFGSLWIVPNVGRVLQTNQNLGGYKTTGVDIELSYLLRMGRWGSLNLNGYGTYVNKWEFEPIKGQGKFDCVGLYGFNCGTPTPKWRHLARATWRTPWNVDLAATWRHIDAVQADTTSSNALLAGQTNATDQRLDKRDYLDLAAAWAINKTFTLRGGVNNVFDKDPPIVSFASADPSIFGNGNTFPGTYDALGRLVFLHLTAKF